MERNERIWDADWTSLEGLNEEEKAMRAMLLQRYGKNKLNELIRDRCIEADITRGKAIELLHDKALEEK